MGIRGRYIGFLLVATVALAFSFLGHLWLFEQWRIQQERQLRRSTILMEVLRLQRLVMDVETNFRGYLLTEQPSFLEPINQAESRLDIGMATLTALTADLPGLEAGRGVLFARLKEFIESKQALIAVVGTEKQEQVRLYVRGGSGRALFLTIEKAVGDFEMRVQRGIPLEDMTYEAWMEQARWQLLLVDSLGAILCIVLTRTMGLPKQLVIDRRTRIPL
ncbi:MAG: CHASE3 domain-containing protein [Nitrospira sp.]|nr:CHASE3 domain-containing protein [Nitrospira sp.]MBS0173801.1 CHASE3 domain-containing protein [Nitrospira sp.]MBX3338214.1 CHASE3 domain-containing protein [Nitrospira sp.]MCW5779958.1 CHASE3 domain-containing protein [Nitrospira sp.]MCW5796623.1 CHASE3 domain-containing protein [Nitrospira sp.]